MSGDGDDDACDDTEARDETDGDARDETGAGAGAGAGAGNDDRIGTDADLPADVEATLTQLLAEAAAAARTRDVEEVEAIVETVRTVVRNKIPQEALRDRLLHGCRAVDRLVVDEPLVAAEYLEAMERLVSSS
ncbi:hypothetical protein [Salinigranum salinum]|uniref:hypothetical protein n=1 Tax=Salinigranum salinum TaxID=1364937 RepID=UPI001261184D|nr:hypothetical protein [Salinigranum salinum]